MFGLVNLKPPFWKKNVRIAAPGASEYLFNYRRIWKDAILLTGIVTLLPLIFITLVNYRFTDPAMGSEWLLRTSRTVSNTQRAISFFLTERRSALEFIVHDNSAEVLQDPIRLFAIVENLQRSFGGGFVDLGLIESDGKQMAYAGPYGLQDKDYNDQPWFKQVIKRGAFTSDVFLGYRHVPHLVIAVKKKTPDGSFYVLRASIAIEPFNDLLANLELGGLGDAFIINHDGILQSNSRYHGRILEKIALPVPVYSDATQVHEGKSLDGKPLFIGYRFIAETPLILMIVKQKNELMKPLTKTHLEIIIFLLVSVTIILAVIIGMVTFTGSMIAVIKLIEEPETTTEELAEIDKGPDFPTGGIMYRMRVEKEFERIPTTDYVQDIAVASGLEMVERIDISVTTENLVHIKNAITENVVLRLRKPSRKKRNQA